MEKAFVSMLFISEMLLGRCKHQLQRAYCAECNDIPMVSPFGFLPLQLDEPYPTKSEKLDARARRQAYPMVPEWWESHHVPKHQCLICDELLDSQFEEHDCHKEFIPDMIQDDIKLVFDDSDSPAVGIDAIQAHYEELGVNSRFISEQCYEGNKVTFPEPQYPTVLKPRTKYRWGTGSERASSFQIDISNFKDIEQGVQNPDGLINWQRAEWMAKRLGTEDVVSCQKLIDLFKGMNATYDMVQGGFYNFINRIKTHNSLYSAINELSKLNMAMDDVTVEWDNKISTDRPVEEMCEAPEKWWIDHLPNKYTTMDTEEDEMEWEKEKEFKVPSVNGYKVKGPSAQDDAPDWVESQPEWYQALHQRVSRMKTPNEIHESGSMVFYAQQLFRVETLEDLQELHKQLGKNKRLKGTIEQLTDLTAVKAERFKLYKWIRPMSYRQSHVFWNMHTNRKLTVEHGTSATFNWLVKQFTKHPNRKILGEFQRSGKYQLLNHQWTKLWKIVKQVSDPYYETI